MKTSFIYRGYINFKQSCDWLLANHAGQAPSQISFTVVIRRTMAEDSFCYQNQRSFNTKKLSSSFTSISLLFPCSNSSSFLNFPFLSHLSFGHKTSIIFSPLLLLWLSSRQISLVPKFAKLHFSQLKFPFFPTFFSWRFLILPFPN